MNDKIIIPKRRRILVFADTHVPYQNESVINLLVRIKDTLDFTDVIHLGDLIDAPQLLSDFETKDLAEDFKTANRILGQLDVNYLVEGNHYGPRVKRKMNPAFHKLLNFKNYIRKETQFIPYDPYDIFRIGKLRFLHGCYHNKYAVNKHLEEFGSCIFGHIHRSGQRTIRKAGKLHQATSVGCTCDLEMDWHRTPYKHNFGFAIVYISAPHGFFQVENYTIYPENRCIYVEGKPFMYKITQPEHHNELKINRVKDADHSEQ